MNGVVGSLAAEDLKLCGQNSNRATMIAIPYCDTECGLQILRGGVSATPSASAEQARPAEYEVVWQANVPITAFRSGASTEKPLLWEASRSLKPLSTVVLWPM